MIKKGLFRIGLLFLYLISLLPFWFLYLIGDMIFLLLYYVIRYRRKVVWTNLRNSFPEKSDTELKVIERKYFRYLGELIVEIVKMFSMSADQVKKHIVPVNKEVLDGYFNEGKSIIGAVAHYGNWEWGCLRLGLTTERRGIVVYKELSNPVFDNAFKKARSRFGAMLVEMRQTLRAMITYKNEPSISMLVSDQTPVRHEIHYFTEFLHQQTSVFLGVEKLAKMMNTAVVYCDIRRVKRGYYKCTFVPLFDEAKNTAEHEITLAHVHYLEKVIREEPQYWLWSHKRWKFKPEDIHR